MSKANDRILRASEIGEYVFCHRAWWLHRVQGFESANRAQIEAGTAKHVEHGRAVQRADSMRRTAIMLFAIAIIFALMYCFVAILPHG